MRKLLLLMVLSLPAFGQYAQHQATVFTAGGKPANQAVVTVCAFSEYPTCNTPITIYSSSTGAAKSNPFQTDVVGYYSFNLNTEYVTVKECYQGACRIYISGLADTAHKVTFADQYADLQTAVTAACVAGGRLYVPGGTYSNTAAVTLCSNMHIYGDGVTSNVVFSPSGSLNDSLIVGGVTNVEIDHLKITGSSKTARLVSVNTSTNVKVHDNTVTGAGLIPVSGPNAGIFVDQSSDVWVERNVLTANGPAVVNSANNADIMVWEDAPSNRIHVRGNQISGSNTIFSIIMFDCTDCDATGNQVNQNNVYAGGGNNGYGIASYDANTVPLRMRIENNNITNTAGNGIYMQTSNQATIVGNTLYNVAQQQTDASIPVAGISMARCDNCSITTNAIDTSGKDGIVLSDVGGHSVISANTIKNTSQYGINVRGSSSDVTFSNNNIQTTTTEGIEVGTGVTLTRAAFTGNVLNGINRDPIQLTGACIDCDISRNIISNFHTGFFGIQSLNASTAGTKIDGNIIDNAANSNLSGGIDVSGGSFYSINGNTILNLTTDGILVESGVTDSIVSGNVIRNVAGTAILTSAASGTQITNNKLLSNGTALTTASSDFVCGNISDTSQVMTCGAISTTASITETTTNGAQWVDGQISESMTLSTGGTTTDSTANLLPANSIILGVVARVTTTITVATDWKLGDGTTGGRFSTANSTLTAGTTQVGSVQLTTGIASATTGMFQVAAAKLRITTTGTPAAGVIRVTVFYRQLVPPTS